MRLPAYVAWLQKCEDWKWEEEGIEFIQRVRPLIQIATEALSSRGPGVVDFFKYSAVVLAKIRFHRWYLRSSSNVSALSKWSRIFWIYIVSSFMAVAAEASTGLRDDHPSSQSSKWSEMYPWTKSTSPRALRDSEAVIINRHRRMNNSQRFKMETERNSFKARKQQANNSPKFTLLKPTN